MRTLALLLLALPVCIFAQERGARVVPPAASSRKLALIIGNNDYRNQRPLRNSANDATDMDAALRGLGFQTTPRLNLSTAQMDEEAGKFIASVRPGDTVLFYYSGHGMQIDSENYLLGVDFEARTASDAKYKAYAASRMQDNLREAGARLQILILDACRDNPFRSLRGGGGGLGGMEPAKGAYIAFAALAGQTADDNMNGRNGLFTSALLKALKEPGLSLDGVFNRVRAEVSQTRPNQVPYSHSGVVNEFYFLAPITVNASATKFDPASEAWAYTKDSQNPDDFDEFVKAYPNSDQVQTARYRAAQLRRGIAPVVAAAPASVVPKGPQAGDLKTNAKDGQRYAWIPPGSFTMGCSPGDGECSSDERPAHRVTISKGFWLGQTAVTQAAYQRVKGNDPSSFKGENRPVEQVSWNEASQYCSAIGGRLPTEAQWEYAARAGTTGSRYGSLNQIARYKENSGGQTHDVAQMQPNAWGLYDMLGNISQWVADWYGVYDGAFHSDPQGLPIGEVRALRGGTWINNPQFVRASGRGKSDPSVRSRYVGFRCVGE